jgi:acetylornithine/N-succinyldiaminopimelate aminotransferase
LRRSPPSLDDLAVDTFQPTHHHNPSSEYMMPSVERPKQIFVRGQGSWLWDSEDRAYLDFTQGGGTNSLGHSPSVLVQAISQQAQSLIQPRFCAAQPRPAQPCGAFVHRDWQRSGVPAQQWQRSL